MLVGGCWWGEHIGVSRGVLVGGSTLVLVGGVGGGSTLVLVGGCWWGEHIGVGRGVLVGGAHWC